MTLKLFNEGTVKTPCYRCGDKKVKYGDCGYSAFNPATIRCVGCGFEVEIITGAIGVWRDLQAAWTKKMKEKKLPSELAKQLEIVEKRHKCGCARVVLYGDGSGYFKGNVGKRLDETLAQFDNNAEMEQLLYKMRMETEDNEK